MTMFARELSLRYGDQGIKGVSYHPGVVRTDPNIVNVVGQGIGQIAQPFVWYITKSVEEGVQTALECSLLDHKELKEGAYYADCKREGLHPMALDLEESRKLWDMSERILKEKGM